jgi:hypothetical protein
MDQLSHEILAFGEAMSAFTIHFPAVNDQRQHGSIKRSKRRLVFRTCALVDFKQVSEHLGKAIRKSSISLYIIPDVSPFEVVEHRGLIRELAIVRKVTVDATHFIVHRDIDLIAALVLK